MAAVSQRDQSVLATILNKTDIAQSSSTCSNTHQCIGPAGVSEATLAKVKQLELDGVRYADNSSLDSALASLTEAINLCPSFASAYNNRGQVYILQQEHDKALADLNRAIELALSYHDFNTLKQSYTQRGILHKLKKQDDQAFADFEQGAKLGNAFAKREALRLNPYAQLCSQTVSAMMKQYTDYDNIPDTATATACNNDNQSIACTNSTC